MHYIPGLRISLSSAEAEIIGIDDAEMGEFAYDYVGLATEIGGRSKDVEIDGVIVRDYESRTSSGARVAEEISGDMEGRKKREM